MTAFDDVRMEMALIETVLNAATTVVQHWNRGDYSVPAEDDLETAVDNLNNWRNR